MGWVINTRATRRNVNAEYIIFEQFIIFVACESLRLGLLLFHEMKLSKAATAILWHKDAMLMKCIVCTISA